MLPDHAWLVHSPHECQPTATKYLSAVIPVAFEPSLAHLPSQDRVAPYILHQAIFYHIIESEDLKLSSSLSKSKATMTMGRTAESALELPQILGKVCTANYRVEPA